VIKKYAPLFLLVFFALALGLVYRFNSKYKAMSQQVQEMDKECAIRQQSYTQLTDLHAKLKEGVLPLDQALKQIEDLRKLNEQRAAPKTLRRAEGVKP